jgi:NOL1/NOP2/fmu family ribosome biogenesis protein
MNIYTSSKSAPYVYMCVHKITGHFYIGYREANIKNNITSDIDLPLYRTSSKIVNPSFEQYDWKILAEFFDAQDAFVFEQNLIKENWNNALLLNRQYRIGQNIHFRNYGEKSLETRHKLSVSNTGKKHTEETRKKLSLMRKGKKRPPLPEEVKRKISESKKGYKFTEQHKKNLSLSHKGKKRTFSQEHRNKLRESSKISQKGIRWYTNGKINKRVKECPGIDYYIGRTL